MLDFLPITSNEFKKNLIKDNETRKWFLWHLNSKLENHFCYSVLLDYQVIGLVCIENEPNPYADIFLQSEFRRKGFGKKIVSKIVELHPDARFLVNVKNLKGIAFFNNLVNILLLKTCNKNENFFTYQVSS